MDTSCTLHTLLASEERSLLLIPSLRFTFPPCEDYLYTDPELVRLRRIIPLRTMPPNSKPVLEFDQGDGHGVNGGLYPDLAKKDATPNKFHRCKDIPPCP